MAKQNNTPPSTSATPANGAAATQQIMTSIEYINSIATRANTVSDQISAETLKQQRYDDQQKIYSDQLSLVNKTLSYLKKLDPAILSLDTSVQSLLSYFQVQTSGSLSLAQSDLAPADVTLESIYNMASQVSARIYQSIQNVNLCLLAVDGAYQMLIKGTKYDTQQEPTSGFGHLPVESGPQNDLVSKFKTCRDAGIAAIEKLANTFLEYIFFLQSLEELRGFSSYLTSGFSAEIQVLGQLDQRVDNRIALAESDLELLTDDYNAAHKNYLETTALLDSLKLDYDLLKAEYNAANASITASGSVQSINPVSK